MADKNERVLIEILTAANLQGVEAASKSFMGLNVQTALLIAAIAAAGEVGKASIENTKAQETSVNDLNQAIEAFNSGYGKAIPLGEKQIAALQKAQEGYDKAKEALALFNLEHQKRAKTTQEQQVLDFRHRELVENLANATRALSEAESANTGQKQTAIIYQQGMNDELDAFLEKNKAFISDQYDTREALAVAIRAGNDSTTSMRLLNDALDLAAIRHESVSEAMNTEILALNGNSKGLRGLGISTDEYNAIMKSTLTTEQKHQALLELIEERTAHGRETTDKLQQTQNKLNKDWQDFTTKIGPLVVTVVDDIVTAADTGVEILSELFSIISAIIQSPGKFGEALKVIGEDTGIFSGNQAIGSRSRRQHGGPVSPGGVYTVGESGPETLVMGNEGGYVAPNGAGGFAIHIHVDRGAFIDGPSVDRLANMIAQRLSYVTGR